MTPETAWASVEAGATLLAAHARLARELHRAFAARQQQAGRRAWATPAIHTLEAWLERQWQAQGDRLLLNPAQELGLWEEAIRGEHHGDDAGLLDVEATAAAAAEAWALAQAWSLPWNDSAWEQSQETAAFRRWAEQVRERCRQSGWITAAELPHALAACWRRGTAVPAQVWVAAFDEAALPLREVMDGLAAAGAAVRVWPPPQRRGALQHARQAADAAQEMAAAAAWAHALWTAAPQQAIAVVAPGLGPLRDHAAAAFAAAFHPDPAPWTVATPGYHIALGRPLTEWPVAAAALQLLTWALMPPGNSLEPANAAALVSSPFLAGADTEAADRARLRRKWAWQARAHIAAGELCGPEAAELCPMLARALQQGQRRLRPAAAAAGAGWARRFADALAAMGWPGERALTSAEHQACQAWQQVLTVCASLDAVTGSGPVAADTVLRRLRALAARRLFQPEQAGGGVQILGWLEAAGLEFDHLWIAGLDNTTVPAPSAPHPFLPRRWQIERGLPHAHPEQEAAFAQRQLDRLRRSADAITISYARADGEQQQAPSPLLPWAPVDWTTPAPSTPPAAAIMDRLEDAQAPAAGGDELTGGTGIFKEQAACPFRAFVHRRLHAQQPGAPPAGLAPATRGSLLHKVLECLWSQLGSQARLHALTPEARRTLAAQTAARVTALEPLLASRPGLAEAEQHRLTELVTAWLEEELTRAPFHDVQVEQPCQRHWGGLNLTLKLDRVDHLDSGGRVLVDYKSGKVSPSMWDGPRPDEPQLPVYYVTDPERESVSAVAFAQLYPGEPRFQPLLGAPALPAWEATLLALASAYLAGEAAVNPKSRSKSCQYCDLPMLCRIGEQDQDDATPEWPEDGDAG